MRASHNVAIVHASFEQAGANLVVERTCSTLTCVLLWKSFTEAQQNQERMQGEQKGSQECLDNAFVESKEANRNLEDAGKRIAETKEKQPMSTTKSELIGTDVDERRRSLRRLRRTSMTAQDVWASS